jgi:methyl-accepting chemotaxis protein
VKPRNNHRSIHDLPFFSDKNRDMAFTIKQKLIAGFAVICLLSGAAFVTVIAQVRRMREIEWQINAMRLPSAMAAERTSRYVSDACFAFRNYVLYGEDAELASKYEAARVEAWKKVFENLDVVAKLAPPEDQELVARLTSDLRDGSLATQEEIKVQVFGQGEAARQAALVRLRVGSSLVAQAQKDATEVTRRAQERLVNDNEALSAAQSTTVVVGLVAEILSVVGSVLIGWLLSAQILAGIHMIGNRVARVAQGDLSGEPLLHRSRDEIGRTAEGINRMEADLKKMIRAVLDSAGQVASAAAELSTAQDQLLESTTAQKQQSQQVAAAMHEMAATIAEVSANASRATMGATEAKQTAHQGGAVVDQTVGAMQSLTTASRATEAQIEELASRSQEIGKIISVIGEIAEQTNLLALNASIEAARAGEQGRGFAVVAGEVRRLAERTAQATRETGELIGSIQAEAHKAVESIQAELAQVNESSESAARAGESLRAIIAASDSVTDMISQIAAAANEQSAATEEVNRSMSEISRSVEMTTTGTHESAKACSELSELAAQLQGVVSEFRLKEPGRESTSRAAGLAAAQRKPAVA